MSCETSSSSELMNSSDKKRFQGKVSQRHLCGQAFDRTFGRNAGKLVAFCSGVVLVTVFSNSMS